ncbi:MAG: helix-turn-helix domain-containing protein [Dehalococcoidia bacterium]
MARRRSRQATEEALLDATISLVAEVGANGFTLSDVANRAGVNRALIYHYFEERETLIERATERALQRTMEGRSGDALLKPPQLLETFKRDAMLDRFFLRFLTPSPWSPAIRERFGQVLRLTERLKAEQRVDFDSEMAFMITALATIAWRCAREQYAELLGVPVDEADRRFIDALTGAALQDFWSLIDAQG